MGNQVFTKPPKPGVRLTKAEVDYATDGPFGCKNCTVWWGGGSSSVGGCKVIGTDISRNGCCDYWNHKDAPLKVGKSGAEYVEVAGAHYTCDECKFFDPSTLTCPPVIGKIAPKAGCNKWMPITVKETFIPMSRLVDLEQVIRESSIEACAEMRGAPQAEGWHPNTTVADGGHSVSPGTSPTKVVVAEMRGAPQANANADFGEGAPVARATEATPATRMSPTPHGTLTWINPPCATCGHSYGAHSVGGDGQQCMFCSPKGSVHRYHETPDMSPHLMTVPLAAGSALDTDIDGLRTRHAYTVRIGTIQETHRALFDETEAALNRLTETIYPKSDAAPPASNDAGWQKGQVYNAHSNAAHRSSVAAFTSGDHAAHTVAAMHHQHAADAASAASGANPSSAKDYSVAAQYHTAQAKAHNAAAATARRGNTAGSYAMSSY